VSAQCLSASAKNARPAAIRKSLPSGAISPNPAGCGQSFIRSAWRDQRRTTKDVRRDDKREPLLGSQSLGNH